MTPIDPASRERHITLRAAFLLMGFVIAVTSVQQYFGSVTADGERPSVWLLIVPLLLAGSMALQFFAKRKDSPLLAISLGLIALSLLALFGLSRGWFR